MRNLKKLLALVLAMVMAFSLMLSASAVDYKDYPDTDSITAEFDEAVRVLTGLKVFQGDEKGFRPADTITRAEAAAIIYRIATQDVAGTQEKLYSDYGTFSDVNKDDWFAGYVGYCQNAGYIKGTSPTTFSPYLKVTGYEMLAMLLRVVGYGKTNEFTGPQWQVNVASLSKELGVINNVKSANFEHTLTMAARRDVVADLAFQTMVLVPTVTYTPALSYNDKISVTATEFNPTLGQKNFGLWRHTPDEAVVDMWGRPGYYWVKDGVKTGVNTQTNKPIYGASFSSSKVVATITETPKLTYTTAVKECDLSHDYGITTTRDFTLYVNDKTPITDSYHVVATDTVTNVGGQGRLTEVYAPTDDHDDHRVVMIDTYLAKVTKVTPATLDAAGHVIVPAKLDMVVYDGINSTNGEFAAQGSTAANKGTAKTISKKANDATNWEYSVGDMLLLNAYTLKQFPHAPSNGDKDHTSVTHSATLDEAQNKAAFEDNAVFAPKSGAASANWADYTNHNLTVDTNVQIVGKSEPTIAKQTVVYYNQNKHNVGGTDTPDAMLLYKDEAATNTTSDWAWYKDQYGNIIGIDTLPNTVQYGVITSLWSSFGQGDSDTDGTAKVYAKVTLADGEETTMVIGSFLVGAKDAPKLLDGHKTATVNPHSALATGDIINLLPIYDYNQTTADVMHASERTVTNGTGTYGYLHVAPVASINSANDTNNWNTDKTYGIIGDNMFKFVTNANGTVTAIEVAGNGANSNMANFAGHNNALVGTTYDADENVLYKNLGYVKVEGYANALVWVDNDTQIMVRNPSTGTITCYNGVSALPGDLVLKNSKLDRSEDQEVDWAETDDDGRAEYLYVTGTFQNDLAYGLFYYNGGGAQWNGTNGTMSGYLNGEATTLTFGNQTMFNRILTSLRDGYNGRLFAVQLSGTTVTNLMGINGYSPAEELVKVSGARTTPIAGASGVVVTAPIGGGYPGDVHFVSGVAGGNTYTDKTEAIYYNDLNTDANGVATGCDVRYDRITRTIKVYDNTKPTSNLNDPLATYTITDATKIVGNLDYLDPNASVQWLNDVTIVFEPNNINAVVEIYVTTQPTVTPPGTNNYLGDIRMIQLGHDGTKFDLDVIAPVALTTGGNYNSYEVKVVRISDNQLIATKGTAFGDAAEDLANGIRDTISITYASATGARDSYQVTVNYYNTINGVKTLVASGSATMYAN